MIELDVNTLSTGKRKSRRLKVHFAHYDFERMPPHPVIRFGGEYLQTFGFNIGDAIDVLLGHGRIIIKNIAKVQPPIPEDEA